MELVKIAGISPPISPPKRAVSERALLMYSPGHSEYMREMVAERQPIRRTLAL